MAKSLFACIAEARRERRKAEGDRPGFLIRGVAILTIAAAGIVAVAILIESGNPLPQGMSYVIVTEDVKGCLFHGGYCEWFQKGERRIADGNVDSIRGEVHTLRRLDDIGFWIPKESLRPEDATTRPAWAGLPPEPEPETKAAVERKGATPAPDAPTVLPPSPGLRYGVIAEQLTFGCANKADTWRMIGMATKALKMNPPNHLGWVAFAMQRCMRFYEGESVVVDQGVYDSLYLAHRPGDWQSYWFPGGGFIREERTP